MAHFAELDENNIVLNVIAVNNEVLSEDEEASGIAFLNELYGHSNWKQTSYNSRIRTRYAGIGFKYDEVLDAFIPPKPFESWILDEETRNWIPPIPKPNDGEEYIWNEETTSWLLLPPST